MTILVLLCYNIIINKQRIGTLNIMNILKSYSDLSIKHGIITPENLAKIASKNNVKAIALTDFMNMFGFLRFYKACNSLNIKPILGVELLIQSKVIGNYKILAYAKNNNGLKNLFNLISVSYTEYGQLEDSIEPHLPEDFYRKHNVSDIIFTNGGIDGFIGSCFRTKNEDKIIEIITEFQNNVDYFYLEINRFSTPNYYSKEIINKYNSLIIDIYKKYNIKFIFTNPILFEKLDDYDSHLIRVSANKSIPLNSELFSATVKDYYSPNMFFMSEEQLKELNSDIYEIEQNFSNELVDLININVETGKNYLPKFKTPNGETEEEYFELLSVEGLKKRLIQNNIKEEEQEIYKKRLNFEINVIKQMGFVGYFLIVQDFINWAKSQDIPVGPGRGSGAGSIVAYSLGITDLDPIPYDLLFERFLNPERVSMPDFDIDFCQERRGEVIHYVQSKYGKEAVSQIMTTGTMASKSVIKDVARALGKPLSLANSISNKVDPTISLMDSYNDINNSQNGLMELIRGDDEAAQIWEHSLKLEGLTKSVGKHAAGVLIAPNKIIDFCPLYQMDDVPVSQLDKNDVEAVGLVKFDFLGLRNLTIIKNTLKMIKENHGIDLIFKEDFTDPKTYELLQKGNTTGVFQLESSGMKKYLMRLKPNCFEDIVAILALYRPGPLGSGMIDSFIKRKAWERDGKIDRLTFIKNKYKQYVLAKGGEYNEFISLNEYISNNLSKDNTLKKRDLEFSYVNNYLKNTFKLNCDMKGFKLFEEFSHDSGNDYDKLYEIPNYFTNSLEECLKPTYGVIVYQEQVMKISQIIAGYSLGGADLLRRCVSGDSMIYVDKIGNIKVSELYNNYKNQYSNICLSTLNETTQKIELDKINDVFYSGKKETFKVTFKSGREINITKDHPILTFDGWKSLENIDLKNDFIALTTKIHTNDDDEDNIIDNYSNEEIKIVAYLIGDGYINKNKMNCSYFCNTDLDKINDFIESCKKAFGIELKIRTQYKNNLKNVYYVNLNKQIQDWLFKHIKCETSEFKEIPEFCFNLNKEKLKLFIGTLWNTDGSFDRTIGHCDYNSKSKKLIIQLNTLLLKLGIFAKLEIKNIKYNNSKFYRSQITGKKDFLLFFNQISKYLSPDKLSFANDCFNKISKKGITTSKYNIPFQVLNKIIKKKNQTRKSWKELNLTNLIGGINFSNPKRCLTRQKLLKFAKELDCSELQTIANSDILWDQIKYIESNGVEMVYDISMCKNHNFIINDVIVHNCMGKKKPEEMAKQRSVFLEGAGKLGYDSSLAMHLFDLMESFAEYGFNKSHSAGYAVITYQTAYLKAHFPSEFMAATLQSENEDTDKLEILIKDCYRNNISVVPPSINISKEYFSVNKKGQIVYGLTGLKKISNDGIKAILEERDNNGAYINFNDFIQRNFFTINKGVLESLILSGCFDCFDSNINRGIYYNSIEEIMNKKKKLNSKSKKVELFLKEDVIKDFTISQEAYNEENNLSDLELSKKEREFIGYELVHSAYEALCKSIDEIYKNNKNLLNEVMINEKIEVYSPTKIMFNLVKSSIPKNSTVVKKILIAGEIEKTPHFEDQYIRINIRDLKENIVCFLDKHFEYQWFKQHKEMLLEGRVVYFIASLEIENNDSDINKIKKITIEKFIDLVNNE